MPIRLGFDFINGITDNNVANNLPLTTGLDENATLPIYLVSGYTIGEIDAMGLYMQVSWDFSPSTEVTLTYHDVGDKLNKLAKGTLAYDKTTFTGSMLKFPMAHTLSDESMVYATPQKVGQMVGSIKSPLLMIPPTSLSSMR